MSEIRVDTVSGKTTSNAVTITGQQGTRVWVAIDADAATAVATDSFNISSVTDDAAGKYGGNINSNMDNAGYFHVGSACNQTDDSNDYNRYVTGQYAGGNIDAERTTSVAKVGYYNTSYQDVQAVGFSINGDLA
jgi:hypothetical protein